MAATSIGEVAALSYARFHDALAEEAQLAIHEAPLTYRVLVYRAKLALRAMQAELDDERLSPPNKPYRLCCAACTAYLATRGG